MMDEALVQKALETVICAWERNRATLNTNDAPRRFFFEHHAKTLTRALQSRPADALEEALTPSGETKYAYLGEFSWTDWRTDENGDEQGYEMVVPWTTIKEIMAAIRERASVTLPQASTRTDALDERGRIVEWLRKQSPMIHINGDHQKQTTPQWLAACVERADHITSNAREG